jgi:hypothetical protein
MSAMLRRLFVLAISLVAVGWLVPLALGIDFLLTWCEHEQAQAHAQHNFPYLRSARDAFTVAGAWFFFVALALGQLLAARRETWLTSEGRS